MANVGNCGELGVRDPFVKSLAMRDRNVAVALAPEDQRRQPRAVEVAKQSRSSGNCQAKRAKVRRPRIVLTIASAFGVSGSVSIASVELGISEQRLPQPRAVETQNVRRGRRLQP